MSTYNPPHFGNLEINSLEDYYHVKTDFNGQEIRLDLNFKGKSTEGQSLDTVKKMIDDLTNYNSMALAAIRNDYHSGGETVKDYIEHHLDEFDETALVSDSSSKEEQLLSKLHLIRVGFYPEKEDQFAVFDYTLGQELTDYLIVVSFKENGEINHLAMES